MFPRFLLLLLGIGIESVSSFNKTLKSQVKYADDCTLPDNWRSKGLSITPSQYLSFLERRVKSGYSVTVRCTDSLKTFTNTVRGNNAEISSTVDSDGYIVIYCDTMQFSPDIFVDDSGKEIEEFCKVGCSGLPLDKTLYNLTHPTDSESGDTPIQYIESTSTEDDVTWETDPATAIKITCLPKFTRPVNDDGVNQVRCLKDGGFTPAPVKSSVHACKPGCEDLTINNVPGLVLDSDSKAVAVKSGLVPFSFSTEEDEGSKITFKCLPSYQMIDNEGEEVEQKVYWCSKTAKGWVPSAKPTCKFNPKYVSSYLRIRLNIGFLVVVLTTAVI